MDVKCLLSRTKEIKMPKDMEKRIVENVLRLNNSYSDKEQESRECDKKKGEIVRKNF